MSCCIGCRLGHWDAVLVDADPVDVFSDRQLPEFTQDPTPRRQVGQSPHSEPNAARTERAARRYVNELNAEGG